VTVWREQWQSGANLLARIERRIREDAALVRRGGHFDRWDLWVRVGVLGRARMRTAVEEHGAGKQLFRFRILPTWSRGGAVASAVLVALAVEAAQRGATADMGIFAAMAVALVFRMLVDSGSATGVLWRAIREEAARNEADLVAALTDRAGTVRERHLQTQETV
jgi:hypothetical protein